jgi:hypothetical protein
MRSSTAHTLAVSSLAKPSAIAALYSAAEALKSGVGAPSAAANSPMIFMSFCHTSTFIVASR